MVKKKKKNPLKAPQKVVFFFFLYRLLKHHQARMYCSIVFAWHLIISYIPAFFVPEVHQHPSIFIKNAGTFLDVKHRWLLWQKSTIHLDFCHVFGYFGYPPFIQLSFFFSVFLSFFSFLDREASYCFTECYNTCFDVTLNKCTLSLCSH